ncbi:MAG TPA: hypothetical protein VJS67_00670 [Pseudonocardiaceae bacterium]|nr:hypothetical protein [Pseudonocardiaceae bacterium]
MMLAPDTGWTYSKEKMPSITPNKKPGLPQNGLTSKIALSTARLRL